METESYKQFIAIEVTNEVNRQRKQGKLTSLGEKMSLSAIGRTLDPPVTAVSMHLVVNGKSESARIKKVVERELGQTYWVRKAA